MVLIIINKRFSGHLRSPHRINSCIKEMININKKQNIKIKASVWMHAAFTWQIKKSVFFSVIISHFRSRFFLRSQF